jgi:hypothetical protein
MDDVDRAVVVSENDPVLNRLLHKGSSGMAFMQQLSQEDYQQSVQVEKKGDRHIHSGAVTKTRRDIQGTSPESFSQKLDKRIRVQHDITPSTSKSTMNRKKQHKSKKN